MMGIQRLKTTLEQAKKAKPAVSIVAYQPNWMYARLFSKTNPTEE